jgi:hypothetical protein
MSGTGREGGRPAPAVLILDAERRVLSATESVAVLLGTSAKALVGRSFDELRSELQEIKGALDDIIVRSDVIPGIHVVMLRSPRARGDTD